MSKDTDYERITVADLRQIRILETSLRNQVGSLEARNAELLAALEGLIKSEFWHGMVKVTPEMFTLIEQARAAIARAKP